MLRLVVILLSGLLAPLAAGEAKDGGGAKGKGRDRPGRDPKAEAEFQEVMARRAASGMRARRYADERAGVAFRYPYHLRADAQDPPVLSDPLRSLPTALVVDGRTMPLPEELVRLQTSQASARLFTVEERDLAPGLRGSATAAAASVLGLRGLVWTEVDYYRDPARRPFAERVWAPAGVRAFEGEGDGVAVVAVRHGTRVSGLRLRGRLADPGNRGMADSLEVMRPAGGRGEARTWLEARTADGRVWDPDACALAPADAREPPWTANWEIETRHYHVTGHQSPQRLLLHGARLEALHREYARLFAPEELPPVKCEVHVFNRQEDFQRTALVWGCSLPPTGKNGVLGGFFAPAIASIWMHEEIARLGGSIEQVMSHECAHQFLDMACGGSDHVPTWVNEGVAVYFETGRFSADRYEALPPGERLQQLRAIYRERKAPLQPLDNYISHRGSIPAANYAEVYAMVHFWAFGVPGGRERFQRYWKELRQRKDGAEAFERIFLADMVKAQGGRAQAVQRWGELLVDYVVNRLK